MSEPLDKTRPHLTFSLVGSGFDRSIPVRVTNVPDAHLERCLKEAAESLINDYMMRIEAAKTAAVKP